MNDKIPHPLARYRGFLLDVDGVLVRGSEPISGAAAGFARLSQAGQVLILTNNSTRSRAEHARRLTEKGFPVAPEQIVASNYVAARHLADAHGPVTVWPLGEDGLREELELAGHRIAERPEDAAWVVAGMDRRLTYETLNQALQALVHGARLLATNQDGTYPTPAALHPGAGAIIGALTGMGYPPALVAGKPSPWGYQIARDHLDLPSEQILMIGDRLGTDIAGAVSAGIDSALVLTGISSEERIDIEGIHPTWVAGSLEELALGQMRPDPSRRDEGIPLR